ncbi:MAG: hypothetical protein MGF17_09755 [Trichodesmium sp. MAG_R04]|nr:hypothetical protein [Trichodesmium sp. MAG_R04]
MHRILKIKQILTGTLVTMASLTMISIGNIQSSLAATESHTQSLQELYEMRDRIVNQLESLHVGSENSSNSQRLVEVAKNEGCVNSYLVSDVNFINWNEINNIKNIGLSSGASAPESLIEEIRAEFSKRYNIKEIQNLETTEDIYFKLPKALEN